MFYVIITYDVNTSTPEGRKRLRNVAKCCKDFGQRVQNSVFECYLDGKNFISLKAKILSIIDDELDSIRIYNLGKKYECKVEQYGKNNSYNVESELII